MNLEEDGVLFSSSFSSLLNREESFLKANFNLFLGNKDAVLRKMDLGLDTFMDSTIFERLTSFAEELYWIIWNQEQLEETSYYDEQASADCMP